MSMNRRQFIAGIGAAPVLAATKKSARTAVPNILLITVEDVGAWMLGIYGNKSLQTPQLDVQGRTGIRLNNACAAAPVPDVGRERLLRGVPELFRGHGYNVGAASAAATSVEQCTRATVD